MYPTPEEKQERQGIISRGINSVNSLRGASRLLSNPINKIASRLATQAAVRGFAAFLASPAGIPILITIVLVVFFTIIVMGFGGAPTIEPTQTQALTPTPGP